MRAPAKPHKGPYPLCWGQKEAIEESWAGQWHGLCFREVSLAGMWNLDWTCWEEADLGSLAWVGGLDYCSRRKDSVSDSRMNGPDEVLVWMGWSGREVCSLLLLGSCWLGLAHGGEEPVDVEPPKLTHCGRACCSPQHQQNTMYLTCIQ